MSVLNKSVLFSALLSLSASAWSQGFYVGLGGGPGTADFNTNTRVTGPSALNVNNFLQKSGTGYFATMFGGYAWTHQSFYLAEEANIDFTNVISRSYNNNFSPVNMSTVYDRMRHTYGLSVLPGYLFTPATLFYGRLGYVISYYSLSTSDSSITNMNKNISGIRFGLGIHQALSERIAMRMEYSQAYYQSTSKTHFDPAGSVTKNYNSAATTSQVEFSFIYNFLQS